MSKEDLESVLGLAKAEVDRPPVSEQGLAQLSDLTEQLLEKKGKIADLERQLAEVRKEEQYLSGVAIPEKMDEVGMSRFVTKTGHEVRCKPWYSGKIIEEQADKAFEWLEENGHGGVIKGEVILPYRRPDADKMNKLRATLEEAGFVVNSKLGVHHSTLRALFREVIESGETLPPDLFDVLVGRQTVIK